MADDDLENVDITTTDVDDVNTMNEGLSSFLDYAKSAAAQIGLIEDSAGKINTSLGYSAETVAKMVQGYERLAGSEKEIASGRGAESLRMTSSELEAISRLNPFGALSESAQSFYNMHREQIDNTMSSIAALGGTAVATELLQSLDRATGIFEKLQQPIMDLDKQSMQMSLTLGRSFGDSVDHIEAFRKSMAATMYDTKTEQAEVIAVQKAFQDAFSADEVTTSLKLLGDTAGDVKSDINLTNAAILVGSARGMEYTEVAKMMSRAHQEFGAEDAKQTASVLGDIALAADKSGLSFRRVADSVMNAASTLKLWGGTVGAVTPMYNTFARALDKGRKGLAPELFEKYISGLQGMQFEMKALLGIQAGGTGRGAIGAGLEMEALMEKEKGAGGMAEMSSRLIDTLKQFSGGALVTRQEAIENPALERNFIVQRQLLKQMLGVDDANATQMMNILQDIDQRGIQTGGDAESKLSELMAQGESIQERTTNTLKEQLISNRGTIISAGSNIVSAINNLADVMGGPQIAATRQLRETAVKTGAIDIKDLSTFVRETGAEKVGNQIMNMLGAAKTDRPGVMSGIESGKQMISDVFDQFKRSLRVFRTENDIEKSSGISREDFAPMLENATDILSKRIQELQRKNVTTGGLGAEELGELSQLKMGIRHLTELGQAEKITGVKMATKEDIAMQQPKQLVATPQMPVQLPEIELPQMKQQMQERQINYVRKPLKEVAHPNLPIESRPALAGPINQAIDAATTVRRERVELDVHPKSQDVELNVKVVPNMQTVTIQVDENRVETIAHKVAKKLDDQRQ